MRIIELSNTNNLGEYLFEDATASYSVKKLSGGPDSWQVQIFEHPTPDHQEPKLIFSETFQSWEDMNEDIIFNDERLVFSFD